MTEQLLYYLWKYRLFNTKNVFTTAGEEVAVIHPGMHNLDSGPDFSNSRIRIGNTTWAGNVEIHIRSSDWQKHRHQDDPAYSNIILHVVYEDDQPVQTETGVTVACVELKNLIDPNVLRAYDSLIYSQRPIPCSAQISQVDEIHLLAMQERVLMERLQQKTSEILDVLQQNQNDWAEVFYIWLARTFGLKVNVVPFEMLARSLPYKIIFKHKDNLLQVEALLFGQAGFLNRNFEDDYPERLKQEYQFLSKKYKLEPISNHLWKFLRMRPANFPTVRIAQFAALVHSTDHLFSALRDITAADKAAKMFKVSPSAYWEAHYVFDKPSVQIAKVPGKTFIDVMLINSVVPLLFAFGMQTGNEKFKDKAIALLEAVSPEKNAVTDIWNEIGISAGSAAGTQALLHLKTHYCDFKKCLECAVGNVILKKQSR